MTTAVMENEYLREALCYPFRCPWKISGGLSLACTRCAGPLGSPEWVTRLHLRDRLVRQYAYAIPDVQAIVAIAALSPLVEIGAGTGYWANLLTQAGADVVCYDERPGRNGWCANDPYYPITVGGPEMAARHPDRALFLCWPPMSRMAARALRLYEGHRLVYVGEDSGGCTADDRFFRLLSLSWQEVRQIDLPQWWGIHDACWLYERKR